jgi:ribosomal protein S18 acetylase RimI-like enzyme
MDYVRKENKIIILSTDDDAIIFYKKYGFEYTEYYDEKQKTKRYNCIYE